MRASRAPGECWLPKAAPWTAIEPELDISVRHADCWLPKQERGLGHLEWKHAFRSAMRVLGFPNLGRRPCHADVVRFDPPRGFLASQTMRQSGPLAEAAEFRSATRILGFPNASCATHSAGMG